jgi:hypothetical protein
MRMALLMAAGSSHQQRRTMNKARVNERMIFDYEERRNALLADGYRLRHETILPDGVICRLHHMANGNDIILSAKENQLQQKTNNVIVHTQQYGEANPMRQH